MAVDLRRTMVGILKKYGHNIFLQRRINTDNSSIKEFGEVLERHTVRSRFPGSLAAVQNEGIEGVLHNADMIYYFKWDANPNEGDRIYEHYERNSIDVRVFTVGYALPMRGRGGRIDFWTVGAKREVVE